MGLISYFRNLYYDSRLKKANKLFDEGKSPEAEKLLLSLVDKHPQAASQLATYYLSLSSSADAKTDVELFRKTVNLKTVGAGVYDTASYEPILSQYITHIEERAKKCFKSGSYNECFALSSVLKESSVSSLENTVLCSEAKIRLIYRDIETTKSTDSNLNSLIDQFKQEWLICRDKQRTKEYALKFCQSLTDSKRYYVSILLLSIIHNDTLCEKCLDNAVQIVKGKDIESSSTILESVVSSYGKAIILRKKNTRENAIALFEDCWKASNNGNVVMEVLHSNNDKNLNEAFIDVIIKNHSSYLSSAELLKQFSEWLYNSFDGSESLGYLERIQKLSYDVEEYYTQKVHSWASKMSIDERITHLDHAQSLYPDSSIIIDDKLVCAQSYLDSNENDKAIVVSDSILTKREKAQLIKAHALCNLAGVEPNIDKRIELLDKAQATLSSCSGSEKAVVMTCVIDAFIIAAKKYYSGGDTIKSYTVLTGLAKKGTGKAAFTIAELRLKEVQSSTSLEEKKNKVTDAIGELRRFGIPSIVNNVDYQQLWKEKTDVLLTTIQSLDNLSAVTNLESLIHEIDSAGLDDSVTKAIRPNVIKEIIKRKYLIARDLEKSNDLSSASNLYKEINSLEAKTVPTLSAIRYAICKLKTLRGSDVLEHRERIYTLLRKAVSAYKSEKDELAYRFAFLLLKAGEDQEALSILSEFLPKEDYLKKACEQGAVIKALAKLDDFNSKIDAVHNKSLSSEETVFFINHMLEYGETIRPVLDLPRSTLGKYRNTLKNYAIFKLFDEEKYDVAFEKLMKEHKDYLDDYTALRNIALVCLNMAEANQITTNNYQEVISIWLTAIYQEQLFVKSLDYTSWDDQFTFSLYDAYGHFNDESLGNLPDNVNNDYSEDNNVVQIKEVQRALLDRFEAAISNTQEYHEFYTYQKDVMDAFIALNLDIKCRIVAPYLAHKDEDVFQGISSALEQDRKQEYDNWEDVLSVGASYQMPQPIYNDYNKAKSYYSDSIEAINALNSSKVGQAFSSSKIDLIKRFAKLSSALISYCNSKISALSANNKLEFKSNYTLYLSVCNALRDSTLSFMFSKFVMQYVVVQVNSNSMTKHEAADYILSILLFDKNNTEVKNNLTTLFEMLAREDTSDSNKAVNMILEKVKSTDTAFYNQLNSEYQQAKIDKELNDIVKKLTSKSMSESTALQKVYNLYKNNNSHDGICEILAQLCTACIMKYVIYQEPGGYSVITVLNSLENNMSTTFKKHRSHFRNAYNSIWNQLPQETQMILGDNHIAALLGQSLNEKGLALQAGLNYMKSLGGFV